MSLNGFSLADVDLILDTSDAITRQLDARGVLVRTGTLINATLIPSAGISRDGEEGWAASPPQPVHGYKAHIATDQDAALIRGIEVTTANIRGCRCRPGTTRPAALWCAAGRAEAGQSRDGMVNRRPRN